VGSGGPPSRLDFLHHAVDGILDTVLRKPGILSSGILKAFLSPQSKAQTVAVVDLVAFMLHEQEKVTEIVRVGNGIAQVRFQHGTERRLTFGLTEPFNIADRFGGLSLHNDRQPMLPAELIRNCANLLVVALLRTVILFAGICIHRIKYNMRMDMMPVYMGPNHNLKAVQVFLRECFSNF